MKEFTAWKEHFCRTKRRSMIDGSKIRGDCFKLPNVHWSESNYFNPPVPPPTAWEPIHVIIPRSSIYGGYIRGEVMVRRFFYQQRGGVEHPFKRTTIQYSKQYCSIEQAAAALLRGE